MSGDLLIILGISMSLSEYNNEFYQQLMTFVSPSYSNSLVLYVLFFNNHFLFYVLKTNKF